MVSKFVMAVRVVIVGAGATGSELARRLATNHDVVLVDISQDALDDFTALQSDDKEEELADVKLVRADGTSRLQLAKLLDRDRASSLVATAGSDEVNREILSFAGDLGFDPVLALKYELDDDERFKTRATVLERPKILADYAERSLEHKGAVVPVGVGLGRGELVEIRLLATSPLLDRPLKDLAPDRWRIAAIFRDDELIVPMGNTRLQIDDRVLLVGDPTVLLTIAENLRKGTPSFPQPYGANIVAWQTGEKNTSLLREAGGLAEICQPARLIRGIGLTPGEPENRQGGAEAEAEKCTSVSTFEADGTDKKGLQAELSKRGAGVLVTSPFKRGTLGNIFGTRGEDAKLCDAVDVPVLFSRGTFPYRRILVPVSPSELSMEAAMVAIDLTRRLNASLTTVNVDLPQYISGESPAEAHWEVVPIRRLCELYELPMEYRHHWGNPVRLLAEEARNHDLVVMARRPSRRDSYLSPDVALWIARRARCSVMVLTTAPRR